MKLAGRLDQIEPFYVMECAKAAVELAHSPVCDPAQGGAPMIYLNIGEPNFTAPCPVQDAAVHAVHAGRTQYTAATGLPALRKRLSAWYGDRFGLQVAPERIVVTAGASAALQLACLALVERGDEVLLPDPSYPCNRHFVAAADGTPVLVPTGASERFQLSADGVRAAWGAHTRGVLLASPSNPTGTSIDPVEMGRIVDFVRSRGGFTLVDEIYLGLSFDDRYSHSALAHGVGQGDDVISINSFSKYFTMTGWRLGWLVLPPELVPAIEKLAQNLFICPSTVAQHAALACFEPASIAEYERRRAEFRSRRDYLVPALEALGLPVPVMPDGAFYAWADCSRYSDGSTDPAHGGSWEFAFEVMRRAHVAITPGRDFGRHDTARFVRFSYANSMAELQEAGASARRAVAADAALIVAMDAPEFRHRLRVYWEDTDAGGVVFYANYLKFFERARTEWLRAVGCSQEQLRTERGVMFVVAETQVRYLQPARLDDALDVSVVVRECGRVGMAIAQQAWRVGTGTPGAAPDVLLTEGRIRIACVDAGTFRPCRIPTDLLDAVSGDSVGLTFDLNSAA